MIRITTGIKYCNNSAFAVIGLVNVNTDDLCVLSTGSSHNGGEHGTAAGEDHFSTVLIPAGSHSLQLRRTLEGSAVGPGVVQLDLNALLGSSSLSTLCEAVAETLASGVGAAATADEAQLGVAFHNSSIASQVAGLLFLVGDTCNVLQNVASIVSNGITIDENELDIGVGNSSSAQSAFLHVASSDNDFCVVLTSQFHSVNAVVVSCLIAVGGLVVLVGLVVFL